LAVELVGATKKAFVELSFVHAVTCGPTICPSAQKLLGNLHGQ